MPFMLQAGGGHIISVSHIKSLYLYILYRFYMISSKSTGKQTLLLFTQGKNKSFIMGSSIN